VANRDLFWNKTSWISCNWLACPCRDTCTYGNPYKTAKLERLGPPAPRKRDREVQQIISRFVIRSCELRVSSPYGVLVQIQVLVTAINKPDCMAPGIWSRAVTPPMPTAESLGRLRMSSELTASGSNFGRWDCGEATPQMGSFAVISCKSLGDGSSGVQ